MLVSFADPLHGHYGGIYQAGGWIYTGTTQDYKAWKVGDRIIHPRSLDGGKWMGEPKPVPKGAIAVVLPGKHRYLYPLDKAMRRQIEPLRQPYPKRADEAKEIARPVTSGETGGASPTRPLLSHQPETETCVAA